MSFLDYNPLIQRVIKPQIQDTVFQKTIDDLTMIFGVNEQVYEGDRITETFKTSITTSAGAYTKADVNPPSFDQEFVKPYWNKVQYHETAEVSRIDLSNKKGEGPRIQIITDALNTAADNLKSKVFDGCMTQLRSDVDLQHGLLPRHPGESGRG